MTPDSWITLGLGLGPMLVALAILGMRIGARDAEVRHLREEINQLREAWQKASHKAEAAHDQMRQDIRENRDASLRHDGHLNKHGAIIDAQNQRLRDLEARRPPGG